MTIKLEALLSGSATTDWVATAMTGTTKQVTEDVQLKDRTLDVSWQPAWTDGTTVLGAFGVDFSNDGATWTPGVVAIDFAFIGPAVATNSDSQMVHGPLRARFVRLTYTNVSGTGTLTPGVHVNGKTG